MNFLDRLKEFFDLRLARKAWAAATSATVTALAAMGTRVSGDQITLDQLSAPEGIIAVAVFLAIYTVTWWTANSE